MQNETFSDCYLFHVSLSRYTLNKKNILKCFLILLFYILSIIGSVHAPSVLECWGPLYHPHPHQGHIEAETVQNLEPSNHFTAWDVGVFTSDQDHCCNTCRNQRVLGALQALQRGSPMLFWDAAFPFGDRRGWLQIHFSRCQSTYHWLQYRSAWSGAQAWKQCIDPKTLAIIYSKVCFFSRVIAFIFFLVVTWSLYIFIMSSAVTPSKTKVV